MDKIVAVGKNYAAHARELGDAPQAMPVLFIKPASCLRLASLGTAWLPDDQGEVHHEIEIVLRLKKGGYRLSLSQAEEAIEAVTLGLDMTLRDVQKQAKKTGSPWETAKAFPHSALVGNFIPQKEFKDYLDTDFSLKIDGVIKQKGLGRDMILNPAECVRYASEHFWLCSGDLIFTGTPEGVGPVGPGQTATLTFGSRIHHEVRWTSDRSLLT